MIKAVALDKHDPEDGCSRRFAPHADGTNDHRDQWGSRLDDRISSEGPLYTNVSGVKLKDSPLSLTRCLSEAVLSKTGCQLYLGIMY
jgi:hypothetical protein